MNDLHALADQITDEVLARISEPWHWPASTYRLQFRGDQLTFRDAAALVPYLDRLGISHVYASPCLKTHHGSPHGYDVVDYGCLNPELGGSEAYASLLAALRCRGMGLVLDIVPNHMRIAPGENAWWTDVLENGPGSPYARMFDIDWHPVKPELDNKVLLPLLEDQYGKVLESGLLRLEYDAGAFFLEYAGMRLPLDPRTYATVLAEGLDRLKEALGPESEAVRELESILTALDYLPKCTETAPNRVAERQREKEVVKGRLHRLAGEWPALAAWIADNVRRLNGDPADPRSFDRLDELLCAQVYRLSHWQAAADEVNYRRFFDVNELAAVSTEEPQVFDAIHHFVLELLVRGDADGLRIDHIDGLYDPREYLRRLQQGYLLAAGQAAYRRAGGDPQAGPAAAGEAPADLPRWEEVEPWFQRKIEGALSGERPRPLYVAVEKILGPEEPLPADWPVAGTTGYDFLNLASRLLVDPAGLAELGQIYQRFVGERLDFREVAYRSKLLILRVSMSSELHVLAHRLNRISERHRRCRDYTLDTLRVALREILACFPVYRTYICRGEVSQRDRQIVQRAVAQAKRRNPAVAAAVFDFVRDVLLLEQPPDLDDAGRRDREVFVGRFQQVTSPLTAKGVEDTAFYRWLPLVSLNEVGGDPARGPAAVDEFHAGCAERRARHPLSLSATTTHDTKRSEDVRARIHVLAEVPRLWRSALNRFARLNRRHRREADGLPAPSRDDEYLFYQTLVGLWPLEPPDPQALGRLVQRLQGYLEKAAHEAKQRTSWINPHPDYDAAIRQFVAAALDDHPKNRFLAEFRAFHERIVPWGLYTALAQAVLKLACPGVPDVYQGQELWDFSLVDPDNRRPVDFALRQEMLGSLEAELAAGGMARLALARRLAYGPRDPRIKLLVTWRLLRLRREHPELSRSGTYLPLAIEGVHQQHVAAFAWQGSPQGRGEPTVVVVVPRLLARLAAGLQGGLENTGPPLGPAVWADTRLLVEGLAAGRLCNLFTGQEHGLDGGPLPLAELFSDFPVAVLTDLEPHA